MKSVINFFQKYFSKSKKSLLNGDPELVRRVQMLLGTTLTITQIVTKMDFIKTASVEEFDAMFVKTGE